LKRNSREYIVIQFLINKVWVNIKYITVIVCYCVILCEVLDNSLDDYNGSEFEKQTPNYGLIGLHYWTLSRLVSLLRSYFVWFGSRMQSRIEEFSCIRLLESYKWEKYIRTDRLLLLAIFQTIIQEFLHNYESFEWNQSSRSRCMQYIKSKTWSRVESLLR